MTRNDKIDNKKEKEKRKRKKKEKMLHKIKSTTLPHSQDLHSEKVSNSHFKTMLSFLSKLNIRLENQNDF